MTEGVTIPLHCLRYLMKLPTPLIPTDHYHNFLQYGKVRGVRVCV